MAGARSCLLVFAACVALGSCGGGAPEATHPQALTQLAAAPSPYGVVSAAVAVEQLLDFAEATYGSVFPSHKQTQTFQRYRYRHYPETGVLVGVAVGVVPGDGLVESGVYVLGGPFGGTPQYVGLLASFVTPVVPMNSVLPAAPTLSAVYVAQLSSAPKGAGAACSNRAAWASAAPKVTAITAQADAKLGQAFPPWNTSLYMAWRTSDLHQSMMADRKGWLYYLVIAECAAWQGKYISTINMVLRELATQPTWIAPAQDPKLRAYNEGHWFMDLMSASMARELAQSLYMLGDRVDSETRQIVMNALETRVFAPVRKTLTDGADGWWLTVDHNWNAVILADVAGAALSVIPSRHDRARFAAMGQHYSQYHIAEYPASGYGIEGPGYWIYGMKHLAMLRHHLHEASGGQVDLLANAKLQAISLYAARIEMTPLGVLAPFGDSHPLTSMDDQTTGYLAAAYGTPGAWPGSAQVRVNPWFPNDMPTVEAAMLLTASVPLAQGWATGDFGWPGLRSYFSDVGVLVTRSALTEAVPLAATIKSAGNTNHSHDDVGSYAIAMNSANVAGDVGRGQYTSRTFSDQRRTVLWINSYGHPVPVVGGRQQVDATTATNTVLSTNFTEGLDEISMNMAPAYALPGGWSLTRSLRNDRVARKIAIQDDFSGFSIPQDFESPITTLGTWTQLAADRLELRNGRENVQVLIEASGAFFINGQAITDDGLTFQRIAIHLSAPATAGWIRVTYSR